MKIITLLSDFGYRDHYVAVIKGEILSRCRDVSLIDITHHIEPQNIRQAAYVLANSWKSFPGGTIHLAVVDPGVGTDRLPLAALLDDQLFICPDNGLLTSVIEAASNKELRIIENSKLFNPVVSNTFHGRDIFAPVTGWLAAGGDFAKLGRKTKEVIMLHNTGVIIEEGRISGEIIHIDSFGNIITSITRDHVPDQMLVNGKFSLDLGLRSVFKFYKSYSEAGDEPFLIWGSGGHQEISLKNSDASLYFEAEIGQKVVLQFT